MATLPFFEPIKTYDIPQVMAAQILEGEAGLSSFKNLFLSPENLSPEERSSLSNMWFEPEDKLSRLFMETVTNPFVWMSFILSPVGAKALNAGKSVFTPLAKYASQNKKGMGWGSWLVTPIQEMKGSNLDRIMQYAPDQVLNVNQKIAVTSNAARELAKEALEARMKAVHGRSFKWNGDEYDLDVTRYLNGTEERTLLQEFLDDVAVVKSGDWKDRKAPYPTVQVESANTWYGPMNPKAANGLTRNIVPDPDLVGDDQAYAVTVERILRKADDERKAARQSFFGGNLKQSGTTQPYWKAARTEMDSGLLPQGMTKGERAFELYWKDHGWGLGEAVPRVKVDHRKEAAIFSEGLVTEIAAKYGGKAERYAQLLSNAEKDAFVFAVGNDAKYEATRKAMGGVTEEVGDFEFDDGKIDGLVGALRRKFAALKGNEDVGDFAKLLNSSENFEGMDAVMSMIGVENLLKTAKLASASDSKKTLKQMLTVALGPSEDRWKKEMYFARTASVVGRINGKTPHFISEMQSGVISEAPYAAAIIYPNNLAPLMKSQRGWDPEFLERLKGRNSNHLTNRGMAMIDEGKERIRAAASNQQAAVFVGSDVEKAHTRYVTRMVTTGVYETHAAPQHLRQGNDEAIDLLVDKSQGQASILKFEVEPGKEQKIRANDKLGQFSGVRVTLSDLTDMAVMREGDDIRRQWFKRNVMPNMLHTMGPRYLAHYNQTLQQRGLAKWFVESIAGRTIEKTGEAGKQFVERLRQFSNPDARFNMKDPSNALSSYLYGTHLGLNMGSVLLNLTQPLIGAALHGRLDDVLVAYGQGFKEVATYVGKRLTLGLNPTAEAKEAAMRASFKHMGAATGGRNILGISATSEEMIDGFIKRQRSNKPLDRMNDALLFGFTTSEMMNRSVAAHLWERINKRAKVALNGQQYLDDAERFIQTYQFGSGPLNTPRAFQEVGLLTNPLARMFMSFPVRSFSSTFMETPVMGGENRMMGLMRTVGRGMGLSALVWETTKVGLGIDISKGLFAEGSTGFLNPERLSDPSESVVPLPPVVDIPIDALRAFSTGDQQLMSTVVSRLFPGGVAIARAVNLAPEAPRVLALGNFPGSLQTTFVGWDQPLPTGEFPVFRGDGTLIEYRTGAEIVARGLGLDMGQWQEQGSLDNYLNKNREQIILMRQEYVRALAANNMRRADEIQRTFQKKFKVPLTVSQEQIGRFLQNQTVGRTERSLDRIDPTVRPQYAQLVDQAGYARNVVGGVQQAPTAQGRQRQGGPVDQEAVIAEIMRRSQAVGPAATQSTGSYQGY